jgi:hypothetical protein
MPAVCSRLNKEASNSSKQRGPGPARLGPCLRLVTPSAAFWDEARAESSCHVPNQVVHSFQESDGAVPLEQRNAELVRHRDGLAEAAVA